MEGGYRSEGEKKEGWRGREKELKWRDEEWCARATRAMARARERGRRKPSRWQPDPRPPCWKTVGGPNTVGGLKPTRQHSSLPRLTPTGRPRH